MATSERRVAHASRLPHSLRRRHRLTGLALMLTLLSGCTPSGTTDQAPSASVTDELRSDVATYVDDRPVLEQSVRAVVVDMGGDTVVEQYRASTADEYYNVASVTKTVLGTLVGIAVDEGLLDLDATLDRLLPQYASTMRPEVAATTPRQLLTMTGPFPDTWRGGGLQAERPDWVADDLARANRTPGTFAYSDPGVEVLAAVLARATGVTLLEYGREKLFDPLGIDTIPAFEPRATAEIIPAYEDADFAWPVDPQGIHLGAGFLKLRAQDLVALGRLHLDEGRWEGRQIVSAEWVRTATTAQIPTRDGAADHYGYLWWVHRTRDGHDAYLAWGYAGQLLEVVPALDLVAVVQTEFDIVESPGMHPLELTSLVDRVIVPAADSLRSRDR